MNDKEIKNILERINNFDKVDKVTEIDLTCAILRLENKKPKEIREIGRAHVRTPVTYADLVCRL